MNPGWRKNYQRYKNFFLNTVKEYRERADWRAYLEILLSLITISVLGIFALRPTLLTISKLIITIKEKESTLLIMNQKIDNLRAAQALYDKQKDEIAYVKEAIPQTPEPDNYLRNIEKLLQDNALDISSLQTGESILFSINPQPKNDTENQTQRITSTVTASADYPALLAFLKQVEDLRRAVSLTSLSLTLNRQQEAQSGQLIMYLTASAAYLNNNITK